MSAPPVNLDATLGAVFVGNSVSAMLFGVTTFQTCIFFKRSSRDGRVFKQLIALLWILDLLHMIFMSHGVYHYLITRFGDFTAFVSPTWSLLNQVIITCLSDLIVRCVFARRIWFLSRRNNFLLFVIVLTSIFVFAMGIAFAARGFIDMSFIKLIDESWILYTALGSSVVADGLITTSLCVLLNHNRSGLRNTDSLVNTLMLYSINTGLLTSICATACFVTFAIWPHQFVFMGIYFALGKLYVNSLLAVLNTRGALRKRIAGVVSIPQSPSSIEPVTMNFADPTGTNFNAEQETLADVARPQSSKIAWHHNGPSHNCAEYL